MGMEMVMTVEEAVLQLAQVPAGRVLVAKPPLTYGAEAMFVELTDDYRVPESVKEAGFKYILGRDDIEYQLEFLKTKRLSSRAIAEFILHYGVNDCPPAWIEDVPDA